MTRSEAIDMLRQICSYLTAGNPMWRTEPIREACEMAIEALAEKEASAVRRGKWEFIGGYGYQYRCSVCITCAEHKTHYCPNCGAKMEENND